MAKKAAAKKKKRKLTDKQKVFCYRYVIHWNAARAVREAGYPKKSAREVGYENLTKPHIQEFVKKLLNQHAMSAEEALARLANIARGDIADYLDISKDGFSVTLLDYDRSIKDNTNLIHSIEQRTSTTESEKGNVTENTRTKLKMYDALAALKLIGTHHKLFKMQMEGTFRLDVDGLEEMLNKEYGEE